MLVFTPCIFELQILRLAVSITMSELGSSSVDLSFGAVGKELHTDDAAVSVVDIERDACVRVSFLPLIRYDADFDIVEEE